MILPIFTFKMMLLIHTDLLPNFFLEYPTNTNTHSYNNYMDYQPYQHSFEGYGPADYSELDDGPPGIGDSESPGPPPMAMTGPPPPPSVGPYDCPPPNQVKNCVDETLGVKRVSAYDPHLATESVSITASMTDDDMEDLRMLGIDVEDAAAANFK